MTKRKFFSALEIRVETTQLTQGGGVWKRFLAFCRSVRVLGIVIFSRIFSKDRHSVIDPWGTTVYQPSSSDGQIRGGCHCPSQMTVVSGRTQAGGRGSRQEDTPKLSRHGKGSFPRSASPGLPRLIREITQGYLGGQWPAVPRQDSRG